jgi:diacylglycerol kinase (ATP)
MRLALVTNVASGDANRTGDVADLLHAAGAEVSVHAFEPGVPDALARAAAAAVAERPDRLAVAGGDGSIGVVAAHAAAAGLPLAVLPTGTANDFARFIGLPLELEEACAVATTATRERPVDILRAGDRPFVNAASAGLSVIAAHHAEPLKRPLGSLAYAAGALRAGVAARPLRCFVRADGAQVFAGEAWQIIVAGTGAFGGGAELEEADPADRLVDVAVLEAGPRLALVRRAWGMRRGGLAAQRGVHYARGRTVELELPPGTSFNVDGEVCTLAPASFRAGDERVRVISA